MNNATKRLEQLVEGEDFLGKGKASLKNALKPEGREAQQVQAGTGGKGILGRRKGLCSSSARTEASSAPGWSRFGHLKFLFVNSN